MKKNVLHLSALFVILFLSGTQNLFAQKILQDWVKYLKAVPPSTQFAARAGIDGNGDAYWCVNTQDSVSLVNSIHLAKYDTLGHLQWMDHYEGTGGMFMTDLKVSKDGSSYVWGNDMGSGTGNTEACFLQKHDGDGNLLWSVTFDPDPAGVEYADQIAICPSSGDIILTAYESSPSYQLFLARFNPDGQQVWSTSVLDCETGDIAVDINDNIYLAGTNHWGTGEQDIAFALLKFDAQGSMVSFYKHSGGGYSHAIATGGKGKTISLDKSGNAVALAWVKDFPGPDSAWTNIMLLKFNADGSFDWKKRLELVKRGSPKDVATLLTDGVTGESMVVGGWGVWKYSAEGEFVGGWHDSRRNYVDACQYDQHKTFPISSGDFTKDGDSGKIALMDWSDDYSNIYVKGRGSIQPLNNTAVIEPDPEHNALYVTWIFNDTASLHRVVLRDEVATSVAEVSNGTNGLSVYPNPASDATMISFVNDHNASFELNVYDAKGVNVAHQKYTGSQSIPFNVKNLSPGIYQITIASEGKLYNEKLMVVK